MTDRELLELAAKAAGCVYLMNGQLYVEGEGNIDWNPLTDDGDALRLAVKLQLIVGHDAEDKLAYAQIRNPHFSANEFYGGADVTPESASRRAIVRAAAEIARQAG